LKYSYFQSKAATNIFLQDTTKLQLPQIVKEDKQEHRNQTKLLIELRM